MISKAAPESEHEGVDAGAVQPPSDPKGVTGKLCTWVHGLATEDVPRDVLQRTKHLILDGIACALIGAHVPWSEQTVEAMLSFEEEGGSGTVFGWDKKLGVLAAALLNGTFIQSTELDDYHSTAPLHSASIILPALLAAAESKPATASASPISGRTFLLASLVGFEVGPRAGLALHGAHMLSIGWHSGAVFGPPAAAAAVGKLLALSPLQIEDAVGIACTQASGLMAAQYEGMVKRMHHGFAARSGLLGALLANAGYTGIRKVFERPYGGFLKQFSLGNGREPAYREDQVVAALGERWETSAIRMKAYAACAGTHGLADAIRHLQHAHPERMHPANLRTITSIEIKLSEPTFAHNGWKVTEAARPLTATGAQMSAAYVAATQLVDGQVLLAQFARSKLDRADVWALVDKVSCEHSAEFDLPDVGCGARVTIAFDDGVVLEKVVRKPKGIDPVLSNEDVVDKFRRLTDGIMDAERREMVLETVLHLEDVADVRELIQLLAGEVLDPLSL